MFALFAIAGRPIVRPIGPGALAARSLTALRSLTASVRVAPSAPTMLPAVASALARCFLATSVRVAPSAFISPPVVVSFPAMPCVATSALVGSPVAAGALLAARVVLIAVAEPLIVPGRAITPHAIVSAAFRRAGRVG
ncbi:hypothetical protein [Microtetraspora malaysiensis]|uniref:hypothetical protein n=1 Tax=Microtetraspora malaysiensis TaxID=161358 RepID=UPI0012F7612F|nr:hypothetical protein [Microtetraspora malaysiensis]